MRRIEIPAQTGGAAQAESKNVPVKSGIRRSFVQVAANALALDSASGGGDLGMIALAAGLVTTAATAATLATRRGQA